MGDKEPLTVFPASKLGEYTVIKDIAEGTFGKVKSMCARCVIVGARFYLNRAQWLHTLLPAIKSL